MAVARIDTADTEPAFTPALLPLNVQGVRAVQYAVGEREFRGAVLTIQSKKANGRRVYGARFVKAIELGETHLVDDPGRLLALPWVEPADAWVKGLK